MSASWQMEAVREDTSPLPVLMLGDAAAVRQPQLEGLQIRRDSGRFQYPAVAMATVYHGEDNLQVFLAEVWREGFTSCVPDAITTRFLKLFTVQQILAVANAFSIVISRPECQIEAVLEYMRQHCQSDAEMAAVNMLFGGQRWQQFLPVASYIFTGVHYWRDSSR